MVLFCLAALIFPTGFYVSEVGGQPYKLPNSTVVGSSYVLFVLSIFFTIVGLLFAGKVCLPGWQKASSLMCWLQGTELCAIPGVLFLKKWKTCSETNWLTDDKNLYALCLDLCIRDGLHHWCQHSYLFGIVFYCSLFLKIPVWVCFFNVTLVIVILNVLACENSYLNTVHIFLAEKYKQVTMNIACRS